MENSPLELYEKAYRLHYIEGNISEACIVYDSIINEFPDSHECGYSVIQLQKIAANTTASRLAKTSNKHSHPLIFANLALAALLVIVLASFFITNSATHKKQQYLVSQFSIALSKASSGHTTQAIRQLGALKNSVGKDIGPYAISAEIYSSLNQYDEAIAELASYKKRYGPSSSADSQIALYEEEISALENNHVAQQETPDSMALQLPGENQSAEDIASQLMAPPPEKTKLKKPKKQKDVLLRDDVTFF